MEGNQTPSKAMRAINNAIFNFLGWLWPVALNLLTVPYVVKRLGEESFGTFSLVLILFFLQLGFSKATIKFVAEYWTKQDIKAINELLGNVLLIHTIIGCFGFLIVRLSLDWLVGDVLRIPTNLVAVSKTAFQIGGLGFLSSLIAGTFRAIPAGLQRFDVVNRIAVSLNTLSTVLTVIVLSLGGGLLHVTSLRLGINLLRILVFFLAAKQLVPSLLVGYRLNWSLLREIAGFEGFAVLNHLADRMSFELTRFLIGSFLGVSAVTYYVVPMNLTAQVHKFLDHFTSILFPLSSELIGTGEWSKLRKMYFKATKYIVILATLAYLPLILLSPAILRLWMGQGFSRQSSTALTVLAVSHYVLSFKVVAYHVLNGFGKPSINAVASTIGAVVSVGLCLVLIPRLGVLGAVIANLGSMIYVPIPVLYANTRVLGVRSFLVFEEAYVKPWLVAGGLTLFFLSFPVSLGNVWSFLAVCTVLVVSYAILLLISGVLDAEDRGLLRRYLADTFSKVLGT